MPENETGFPWWLLFGAGAIIGLMFLSCPGPSVDQELAHVTREALELASEAQADDRSAVLWTGRFRLLALVIGVSVPLIVAYLIWRASSQSEIDPTEVIEQFEVYSLPEPDQPTLPPASAPPSTAPCPKEDDSSTASPD
jgi:hypothetical protein